MDARLAFYAFVTGIINMLLTLRPFVGPFILMGIVIKVVRWAWSTARGEKDYDDMQQEYTEQRNALHNRVSQYRDVRYLRRIGFTNQQIRHHRGQHGGTRHRW